MTDDPLRATGRTKRQALRALLAASEQPNEWHYTRDHYPGPSGVHYLESVIKELAGVLRLDVKVEAHTDRNVVRIFLKIE